MVPTHETDPPTYDGLPVIGNTHQLVREQNGLYEGTATQGDVVRLRILGIGDVYQINHPDLAERILVDELDDTLDGEHATFGDLPDLEYTEQVFREAMGLSPPVPSIPRETTEARELGGYSLPEGATVAPMRWTIHRDERFWEEPLQFRPDRFAGETGRRSRPSPLVVVPVGVSVSSSRSSKGR